MVRFLCSLLALVLVSPVQADRAHPRLLLSAAEAAAIRAAATLPPRFHDSVEQARARVNPFLGELPDVPLPADPGGGYTHEQHKRNQVLIYEAGVLFQLTGETAYADLAGRLLRKYADLYPTLGEHPANKNQAPGRLFWQSLNEAVWLVYSIQGYDAVYLALSDTDQSVIESRLFRPMAAFLADESPQTFDRIHNHGTWAVAAVGMTGYVLGDEDLVEKALLGLKRDGEAGFLKQLDLLFSPDGYYNEGPYYQRYALMPFVLFAAAVERNEPGRRIFEHRDGILRKAIYATVHLSYAGLFFPINDALKDKGLDTAELIFAIPVAYALTGDPGLLSIAMLHDRVALNGDGYRVAQALDSGKAEPFPFRSISFSDGPDGTRGALQILRSSAAAGHQAMVLKATAQGLGHGHFDRLNWLYYDNGREVITDYGAARFLNVEEKAGGRYLPENTSWAKQTVAHNTLVVDETSQFGGDWREGEKQDPEILAWDAETGVAAARMVGAHEGVDFTRTLVLLRNPHFQHPLVLDVLKIESAEPHRYDLPLHFDGQVTHVSHPVAASTEYMQALGQDSGYQHLWLRAQAGLAPDRPFSLTWLNGNRFYTYIAVPDGPLEVLFTETGANDPDFNLRRQQALILRAGKRTGHTFAAVLESHGEYNGTREYTTASASHVQALERLSDRGMDVIRIVSKGGGEQWVALSHDPDPGRRHSFELPDRTLEWSGYLHVFDG
jgi:hypothetical protein